MTRLIVDRIEEAVAVCEKEDGTKAEIDLSILPSGVHEGSVILIAADGSFTLDCETEQRRREELYELQESLFEK